MQAPNFDDVKVFAAVVGTVVSVPTARLIWKVAGDWAVRGEELEAHTAQLVKIGTQLDEHIGEVRSAFEESAKRQAKTEFILTGAEGLNGIRQEVKDAAKDSKEAKDGVQEIKQQLHNDGVNAQNLRANWSDWRDEVNAKLAKPRPRRANSGRRSSDVKRKP